MTGQIISALQKDLDDKYRLDVYLMKPDEEIDPFPWFQR